MESPVRPDQGLAVLLLLPVPPTRELDTVETLRPRPLLFLPLDQAPMLPRSSSATSRRTSLRLRSGYVVESSDRSSY